MRERRHREIVTYYDQCEIDYRLCWDLGSSLAMHMGFWDHTTRNLREALARMNQTLAKEAKVRRGERILDAGCGIGGSAIYLAKHHRCHVVGITLSRNQVESARANARRNGVAHLTEFLAGDYLHAPFADASFDVVWALESICYAPDKGDFVREASRLLRSGGRLVVADGFTIPARLTEPDDSLLHAWLSGWAVPGLENRRVFERHLQQCGFVQRSFKDVTRNVERSSARLFLMSLLAFPLGWLAEFLRLRTSVQTENILGGIYQYLVWRKKLALYGLVSARKPAAAAQDLRREVIRGRARKTG